MDLPGADLNSLAPNGEMMDQIDEAQGLKNHQQRNNKNSRKATIRNQKIQEHNQVLKEVVVKQVKRPGRGELHKLLIDLLCVAANTLYSTTVQMVIQL